MLQSFRVQSKSWHAVRDAGALSKAIAELASVSEGLPWQNQLGLGGSQCGRVSAFNSASCGPDGHGVQSAVERMRKQVQESDADFVKNAILHVKGSLQQLLVFLEDLEVDNSKQQLIEQIKTDVLAQWNACEKEKDYIIFGGLVSNGKTSLVMP